MTFNNINIVYFKGLYFFNEVKNKFLLFNFFFFIFLLIFIYKISNVVYAAEVPIARVLSTVAMNTTLSSSSPSPSLIFLSNNNFSTSTYSPIPVPVSFSIFHEIPTMRTPLNLFQDSLRIDHNYFSTGNFIEEEVDDFEDIREIINNNNVNNSSENNNFRRRIINNDSSALVLVENNEIDQLTTDHEQKSYKSLLNTLDLDLVLRTRGFINNFLKDIFPFSNIINIEKQFNPHELLQYLYLIREGYLNLNELYIFEENCENKFIKLFIKEATLIDKSVVKKECIYPIDKLGNKESIYSYNGESYKVNSLKEILYFTTLDGKLVEIKINPNSMDGYNTKSGEFWQLKFRVEPLKDSYLKKNLITDTLNNTFFFNPSNVNILVTITDNNLDNNIKIINKFLIENNLTEKVYKKGDKFFEVSLSNEFLNSLDLEKFELRNIKEVKLVINHLSKKDTINTLGHFNSSEGKASLWNYNNEHWKKFNKVFKYIYKV